MSHNGLATLAAMGKRIGPVRYWAVVAFLLAALGAWHHALLTMNRTGVHAVGESVAADLETPARVDLGHLKKNECREFSFVLKNTSGHDQVIKRIQSSCGCTHVELHGDGRLAAGSTYVVTGTVAFGNLPGFHESRIRISSQSTRGDAVNEVLVRGEVIAALTLGKGIINFGELDYKSDTTVASVKVMQGNSGEKWDQIKASCDDPHLTVNVETISGEDRIVVRLSPLGLPLSRFHAVIKLQALQTGERLMEQTELPVDAHITGPMKAWPESIYFGLLKSGETFRRSILVSSPSLDMRDIVVEKEPDGGHAQIKSASELAVEIDVRLSGPDVKEDRPLTDTLTLLHKSSGAKLVVPLFGFFRGMSIAQ